MKTALKYILIIVIALTICRSSFGSEPELYTIVEGKGIRHLASLGDHIQVVTKQWGKPDREAKDDFPYATDIFYEYRKRGVLFISDKNGIIKGMTFYCNTGNKEPYHKTGLIWINPSSRYDTFMGATSSGLILKDKLLPRDVYKIYGKPKLTIKLGEVDDIRQKIREGKPFIYDMGNSGYNIIYPNKGLYFSTFNGFVEDVTIQTDYERPDR